MQKGLMILSDNCEDVEALASIALLRRAGFEVTSATFNRFKEITTKFKQTVKVDETVQSIDQAAFDFLVLPGGPYVDEVMGKTKALDALIKSFNDQGKLIAAICAAPRFLGALGLLDGKVFTGFTGADIDAPKGLYHPEAEALKDGNIITARGAGVVYAFVYEITRALKDQTAADQLMRAILHV